MGGALVLGAVVFRDFEVPERLRFGGKQQVAVHLLPGGGRVVDAMGGDEGPLSWSGVFSGPGAGERSRLLDGMRRRGDVLALSWGGWRYTVVIRTFEAEAMNPAWLHYRIEVCVVAVGDLVVAEALPLEAGVGDAAALGVSGLGVGLDGAIAAAGAGLGSSDVGAMIAASGSLARLITGRALLGSLGGN